MSTNPAQADAKESDEATASASGDTKFRYDFHLKEWETLRTEIDTQIAHTRNLELTTVAGLGAFYAWFWSVGASHPARFLLLVPSLLVLLAGLRAWGTLVRIEEIAVYLRTIENAFSLGHIEMIGWERTRKWKFPDSYPFKMTAGLFWIASLVVSILAWILL